MNFSTAIVTGAHGFIGSALVRRLMGHNVEPWVLIRPTASDVRNGRPLCVRRAGTLEPSRPLGDVPCEVVFHLASAGVRPGESNQTIVEGNVNLMVRLLEELAGRPPRLLIYTGSCSEYGDASTSDPISEDVLPQPRSLYGAAKLSAYLCGRTLAAQYRIPFVNLRLFGVYGPGEHPARLIPYVLDRLSGDQPADLTPGNQVRDLTNVEDVVTALLAAAQSETITRFPVYNVCSGRGVRIRDVGTLAAELLGKPPSLLRWGAKEYRSDEPLTLVGSNRRFTEATGWQPTISLEEGIQLMIDARAAAGCLENRRGATSRHTSPALPLVK